jgi:hypothetical protein
MGKFKLSGLIAFLIIFPLGLVYNQVFILEYSDSNKNLTIQSDQVRIRSEWISPSIHPDISREEWKHISRTVEYDELAGIPGNRTTDIFTNRFIEIERHIWISEDNKVVALRQKLSNVRKDPITLKLMVPLACNNAEDLILKGNPEARNWSINVQKRHKNDFPETVKPAGNLSIIADPFLAVSVGSDPDGPCLLIGYLDWLKHLASIKMSFINEQSETVFSGLYANCEFNDVEVPPDGTRTTQWIYITVGQDFIATVDEYTDRVAKYHNIKEPQRNAPSVFCSWYWYGKNYTEEYLLRDLQALKDLRYRKPFDVFLIDESWEVNLWGDFTNNEQFPDGMKFVADRIKESGYIPGIWTPPYLVSPTSDLFKKHPDWVLKTAGGDHYTFRMNDKEHLVIDLTYPGVLEYLEESYRKLSEDWGFKYFKFDFMRAVFLEGDYRFFNPNVNRLEAYRMGLEAIRRGVGDDAYISVCGGHYGGSIGIANSQRSGSDVVSYWDAKEIPKYRQNILRTWMSRLWHVDPDAMMVRRNEKPEFPGSDAKLSLGLFTDNEAQINALNQYIGGGLVTFTENYTSLDADRLELYKHVIPSVNSSSFPVDWYNPIIPEMMVTQIDPVCRDLEKWNTIAIVNWTDQKKTFSFNLDDRVLKSLPGNNFILFEFFSQEIKGLFKRGELVNSGELDPHSGLLFKIVPWDGINPVLAGTDLHFSMGGFEIKEWDYDVGTITGILDTDWFYPVMITAVFPAGNNGYKIKRTILQSGQKRFWLEADEK